MMNGLRLATSFALGSLLLSTLGCNSTLPAEKKEGSGHVVLQPVADPAPLLARSRQVIYVPVYSAIYWGFNEQLAELAVTLSIRNVNRVQPIVVHSAEYYGSSGEKLRDLVSSPAELGPLATADFVIQQRDKTGGTGASFVVEWSSDGDVDEPVVEAVMVGHQGNVGISFSAVGRTLPKASAASPASR